MARHRTEIADCSADRPVCHIGSLLVAWLLILLNKCGGPVTETSVPVEGEIENLAPVLLSLYC